jgi:threonine synthase
MDILIVSKHEKLLFIVSGFEANKTADYMSRLAKDGRYEIDAKLLADIKAELDGGYADEDMTVAAIGKSYEKYNYVMDPHTAVAYSVSESIPAKNKRVILSTASPYKFPASVISGLKGDNNTDNEFELFSRLNTMTGVEIPQSLACLENADVRFKDVCEKEEMTKAVYNFLGI